MQPIVEDAADITVNVNPLQGSLSEYYGMTLELLNVKNLWSRSMLISSRQSYQFTILPKNTPVLLKTNGQESIEWLSRVADGDATIETNLFKGTTEAMTVSAESVLTLGHATDGNKEIGFWLYTGTDIPANRAYLEKKGVNTESRGLTLSWEGNSMGIGAALNDKEEMANDNCFDLLGRPMVNGQRSKVNGQIRITNGKKYLVR